MRLRVFILRKEAELSCISETTVFGKKKKTSVIKVEVAPELKIEEGRLVEIKDEMILARLNQAVPEIARAMSASSRAVSAVQSPAYKCVLPAGATLTSSKAVKGAVKGFYRGRGGKIAGQANWIPVGGALTSVAAASFSVVALIVGQKFMSDISKRLLKLGEEIRAISDFQHHEYKSRVDALVLRITNVISYRHEVVRDEQVRMRTLFHLDDAESECVQLLGQANETILSYTQTRVTDFTKYCAAVCSLSRWLDYQNKLIAVLYHISELKYALGFGSVTKDFCAASFRVCLAEVSKSQKSLKKWHYDEIGKLGVDTSSLQYKRKGVNAALHFFPSLFKKDYKYKKLPEEVAAMIEEQRTCSVADYKPSEGCSFESDLELVVKDGKIYYLEASAE